MRPPSSWLSKRLLPDGRHEVRVRDTGVTLHRLLQLRQLRSSDQAILEQVPELLQEDLLLAWRYLGLPAPAGP
jgi:hypothetical protein